MSASIATWHSIFLGLVEGITEFLPISSTGHLILAAHFLGVQTHMDLFEVCIQMGAILAVCVYYHQKIIMHIGGVVRGVDVSRAFALNVIVATVPAVFFGLFFGKMLKTWFFNPLTVSINLFLGGCLMLWIERRSAHLPPLSPQYIENIPTKKAFHVGLVQCLALFPGVSRSGATIIGGMLLGLPRVLATEFSFFLAIPIILGAGTRDLYKHWHEMDAQLWQQFGLGMLMAFVSAMLCIHWLLRYVAKHSFTHFAYYRIIFGGVLLALYMAGTIHF